MLTTSDLLTLFIGFVLGVLGTLPFWLLDRRRSRKEVASMWTRAMRTLEFLMWKPETQLTDLLTEQEKFPLDLWRRRIGDVGFSHLERLVGGYGYQQMAREKHAKAAADFYAALGQAPPRPDINILAVLRRVSPDKWANAPHLHQLGPTIDQLQADPSYLAAEDLVIDAGKELNDRKTEFANLARRRSSEEYDRLMTRERRVRNARHPIRWARNAYRSWRGRRRARTSA